MAFNKEQKLVIDELEKNILLLASAGEQEKLTH